MNERNPFYNFSEKKEGKSDLNKAIKSLLATQINRMKAEESNSFLKKIDKYFDYLPNDFKTRLSIYFDNNLAQDSSLGQELKLELKNIIKNISDNVEIADYEIIDNKE